MSIRSVDLQMLIPKTQQQSKILQQENDRMKIEHQQAAQQDKKNIELQLSRVNPFDKKNEISINNSISSKRQKSKENKKKSKPDNYKEDDEVMDEINKPLIVGSRIDIKI